MLIYFMEEAWETYCSVVNGLLLLQPVVFFVHHQGAGENWFDDLFLRSESFQSTTTQVTERDFHIP